jgi:hypothetical protein
MPKKNTKAPKKAPSKAGKEELVVVAESDTEKKATASAEPSGPASVATADGEAKKGEVPAPVVEAKVAAEFVDIEWLTPWSGNPRLNEGTINKVVKSIEAFGFGAPIVARKANGEIIAGHTRYAAAVRMNMLKVPVRYLDITARQAHLLALADNKLGEDAEWDQAKLAKVLRDLKAGEGGDADLLAAGFAEVNIDGKPDVEDSRIVRFKRWKYPVTDAEAEKLHNKITVWLETKGQLHGFFGKLLR